MAWMTYRCALLKKDRVPRSQAAGRRYQAKYHAGRSFIESSYYSVSSRQIKVLVEGGGNSEVCPVQLSHSKYFPFLVSARECLARTGTQSIRIKQHDERRVPD
jgi:hypothetical protein